MNLQKDHLKFLNNKKANENIIIQIIKNFDEIYKCNENFYYKIFLIKKVFKNFIRKKKIIKTAMKIETVKLMPNLQKFLFTRYPTNSVIKEKTSEFLKYYFKSDEKDFIRYLLKTLETCTDEIEILYLFLYIKLVYVYQNLGMTWLVPKLTEILEKRKFYFPILHLILNQLYVERSLFRDIDPKKMFEYIIIYKNALENYYNDTNMIKLYPFGLTSSLKPPMKCNEFNLKVFFKLENNPNQKLIIILLHCSGFLCVLNKFFCLLKNNEFIISKNTDCMDFIFDFINSIQKKITHKCIILNNKKCDENEIIVYDAYKAFMRHLVEFYKILLQKK